MQRRWIFPTPGDAVVLRRLAGALDVPEWVAGILLRNGISSPEDAAHFLRPQLRNLSDPFVLPNMDTAVERLDAALRNRESILLYGDYDVDGVASLAFLRRVLQACGGRVECFLPHRVDEGYGLSPGGVERCLGAHAPSLLIAVDCGTNSTREVAELRRRGIDVLIFDHHEPSPDLPDAVALVNPKLGDAMTYLCSGGVVFKVAHALLKRHHRPDLDLREYLDLVALATVADIVPLVGENRILVHHGLQQMARTRWAGLRALMAVAGVKAPIRGSDIGFRLGPRINAAGRLDTAAASLQLLLTDDAAEAHRLAADLDRQNRDRQSVERHLVAEVDRWVEAHFDPARDASIVAGQPDWHHGVLGIVAARVMRRHHRPTLLVGFDDETGIGKGSGRSIEGLSLVETLGRCAEHLEKFGGHEMAAGLTVHRDRFDFFRRAFEESARALVTEEILTPKLRVDAEIPLSDVTLDVVAVQALFEPCGCANTQPVYAARGVQPTDAPRVLKDKHLRIDFREDGHRIPAIFFNTAPDDLPRPPWDVAFRIERNEFNGRLSAQMHVVAIRAAA